MERGFYYDYAMTFWILLILSASFLGKTHGCTTRAVQKFEECVQDFSDKKSNEVLEDENSYVARASAKCMNDFISKCPEAVDYLKIQGKSAFVNEQHGKKSYDAGDTCSSPLTVEACTNVVDELNPVGVVLHELCDIARSVSTCLEDLVSQCPEIKNSPNVDIPGFMEFVVDYCDPREEDEMKCLDESTVFLFEAVDNCKANIDVPAKFKLMSGSYTKNDRKCLVNAYNWMCVKDRMEKRCGKAAAAVLELQLIERLPKKINYGPGDLHCIKWLGENKKRSSELDEMRVDTDTYRLLKTLEILEKLQ